MAGATEFVPDDSASAPKSRFSHPGPAADFISRSKTRQDALDNGCNLYNRTVALNPDSAAAVEELLAGEALYGGIVDILTAFWRQQRHPAWARVGKPTLVQRCREILRLVHETRFLRITLSCFLLSRRPTAKEEDDAARKLKAPAVSKAAERTFWDCYQATAPNDAVEALEALGARRRPKGFDDDSSDSGGSSVQSPGLSPDAIRPPLDDSPSRPKPPGTFRYLKTPRMLEPVSTQNKLRRPTRTLPRPEHLPADQKPRCANGHLCPDGLRKCRICGSEVILYGLQAGAANSEYAWSDRLITPSTRAALSTTTGYGSNEIRGAPVTVQRPHRLAPLAVGGGSAKSPEKTPRLCTLKPYSLTGGGGGGPETVAALCAVDVPLGEYLHKCHREQLLPLRTPFTAGYSKQFSAAGLMLQDCDLKPLTAMAKQMGEGRIEVLDVGGNALLTDDSIVPLFQMVARKPSAKGLVRISLHGCRSIGAGTLEIVTSLLKNGLLSLRTLDLGGIAIPVKIFESLAEGIGRHPSLREACLADTALDHSGAARRCVSEILRSSTMETLDIGWSCFDAQAFAQLGAALAGGAALRSLRMPNCSATPSTGNHDGPIDFFFEQLARNQALTFLDVSLNRIDHRGALALEDALESHRCVCEVDISQNRLGAAGMRSLLRVLAGRRSGLKSLVCEGCAAGAASCSRPASSGMPLDGDPTTGSDAQQLFNPTHPMGHYRLNLARPYHRALLRMLYKACDRLGVAPGSVFADLAWSQGAYSHPQRSREGLWPVQSQGVLAANFGIAWAGMAGPAGIGDGDFGRFLEWQFEKLRLRPGCHKVAPLMAHWRDAAEREDLEQQFMVLGALSRDFCLTCPQLLALCDSAPKLVGDVLRATLHCVVGGQAARYLSALRTPSLGEFVQNRDYMRSYHGFSPDNPSWHYSLDLGNASEYAVAEKLVLLDRWEVDVALRQQRFDSSQFGDHSHLRNVWHQGRPLRTHELAGPGLPSYDVLTLDYTTGKRPPPDARALDAATFALVVAALQTASAGAESRVVVLRHIAPHVYLSSLQLREILGLFGTDQLRGQVLVLFYFRIVDVHNEKCLRAPFEDTAELMRLRNRLGHAVFLPFVQPEQASFELDFSHHDQRVAASFLCALANKERSSNIHSPSFTAADGILDPMPFGVPRSWETLEKMPRDGVFRASYVCAPEERNFAMRRAALQRYGHFAPVVSNDGDVTWWSSFADAPPAVQDFVRCLVVGGADGGDLQGIGIHAAFKRISQGGETITLQKFTERLKELDVANFRGPDEDTRIENLFRYLDPSGRDGLSLHEWGVLEELWQDVQQSMREFVRFLERSLGQQPSVLENAWEALTNGDGDAELGPESSSRPHSSGSLGNSRRGSVQGSRGRGSVPDSRRGSVADSRRGSVADARRGSVQQDSRRVSVRQDSRRGSVQQDDRRGSVEDSRRGSEGTIHADSPPAEQAAPSLTEAEWRRRTKQKLGYGGQVTFMFRFLVKDMDDQATMALKDFLGFKPYLAIDARGD